MEDNEMYKAILNAMDRMNGLNLKQHILAIIFDGFVFPAGEDTIDRQAIRKVACAGELVREWQGWSFRLPHVKDAMEATGCSIMISGQLYEGHSSFEDCPYESVYVDPGELFESILANSEHPDAADKLSEHELIRAYTKDTVQVLWDSKKSAP